jgi:membrane protease YdiL (CAAX protease family)
VNQAAGPGGQTGPGVESRVSPLVDVLALFAVGGLFVFGGLALVDDPVGRQMVVWWANVAMMGVAWGSLRVRGESVARFGLTRIELSGRGLARLVARAIVTFIAAVTAFVAGSIVHGAFAGRPAAADTSSYGFLSGNLPMLLLVLAGVFVASSFGEEWVYRGFLTTRLREALGERPGSWAFAVAGSSLIFGLAHYDWGIVGIVQTTFMGAALATAWLKFDRNLWVVVLAHAAADAILMVQLYLQ